MEATSSPNVNVYHATRSVCYKPESLLTGLCVFIVEVPTFFMHIRFSHYVYPYCVIHVACYFGLHADKHTVYVCKGS